jgi:trans-2,3-dihydro-3-hydroxyanthranilate isomerase
MKFYIVDVFAEEKYTGNQLAVFTNIASLSDKEMQQIAKEMNYSETTFIVSEDTRNGGYDVRIFTPKKNCPLQVILLWVLPMYCKKKLLNNHLKILL